MDLSFSTLLSLVRFTVQSPREGARAVMRLDLPMGARWTALAFTAVASALLTHLTLSLLGADPQVVEGIFPGPVAMAIMQGIVMVLTALAVYGIGRWRGGTGQLADAVILMAWLQFILLCLQVVQALFMLVLPVAAEALGLVGLALFLWLLSSFVAEMHGFRSTGMVLGGVIVTIFALAFVLSLLLVSIVPQG